ncbi:conserved hypothetical protein [Delftia phage PhiW-14]|uniref:Uncharacterized protein n=1 Tax=Delftia phage PhiW-14 TaxID=665032 RepID=C9DFZ6_BPW14|nr:RuvC-like Holliday junction resolvase [Delftia phage PhiW-14]ACV50047.1 conserved hypothetical protein [Delftia phage PhiW-14]
MIVAGIDYSMSSPAICIYDTTLPRDDINSYTFYCLHDVKRNQGVWCKGRIHIEPAPKGWAHTMERYTILSDWAMSKLKQHGVEQVYLEGYALGSTTGLVFNIAENTALLKLKMWQAGIKFETPTPSQVKKFYTGNGAAKKPMMCDRFEALLGVRVSDECGCKRGDAPENDIADSHANLLTGLQ